MFTGLLPRAAGIGTTGAQRSEAATALQAQRDRVLPEVLRRAGYRTRAVSTNLWVSKWTGFDTGFDEFVQTDSGRQTRIHANDLRSRAAWAREAVRADVDDGAAAAERVLESWLHRLDADRPFFWFVNLIECHSPYLPPRPYNDLGPVGRLRAGIEARRHLTLGSIWRACVGEFDIPDHALERMRHLYAGSIRYMDDWLGRLLERLDAIDLLDETVVILTSDHGENFGEGGLIAHALSLDDRLIHVPLVAAGPGIERLPAGVTSLADLPRLVADIAELDVHPWQSAEHEADGVAVAQLDPPAAPDHENVPKVRNEWGLDQDAIDRLTTPFMCATNGRFKMIRRAGRDELVDLQSDRLELNPVDTMVDRLPVEAAQVLPRLAYALDHTGTASSLPAPVTAGPTPSDEETQAIEERMRLLGYL
jgi:arylsulfatase A-like enzyme